MPPIRKIEKEDILNEAYEIVKKEGYKGLNARKIAKNLSCSVQPIFHNYKSMEELQQEVLKRIFKTYEEYLRSGNDKENPYKEQGLSYIRFAKENPEFFKIIFMQETNLKAENFMMSGYTSDEMIQIGQTLTGLSFEEQKKFHLKVWIFTHGIACLVVNGTVSFTEEEINKILGNTVIEMLYGYKKRKETEK